MLGQQASNWLLRQWENGVESPAGTANFINNRAAIAEKTFIGLNDLFKNDSTKCKLSDYVLFNSCNAHRNFFSIQS